jgi:hypothetical protein
LQILADFNAIGPNGELILWDVKAAWKCKSTGKETVHVEDDSLVKLKTAARMYRWIRFVIVYRLKNGWHEKEVQP